MEADSESGAAPFRVNFFFSVKTSGGFDSGPLRIKSRNR